MPPIPVYSDAPIVAAKPDGVTPQSANEPTPTRDEPARINDTTASSYAAARPGQAAVPAPTSSVPKPQPPPTRTITQVRQVDGPPLPQPGAVPTAPSQTASSYTASPSAPSTSRPDINATTTQQQSLPSQFSIPPPTSYNLATHSTDPTTTFRPQSGTTGPTTLPLGDVPQVPPQNSQFSVHEPGRQSSELPPGGYRQDPFAAEMSAAQRDRVEAMDAEEKRRRGSLGGIFTGITGNSGGAGTGGGLLGGLTGGSSSSGGEEGVWGQVKALASTAATKAAELEGEVWKMVEGKK